MSKMLFNVAMLCLLVLLLVGCEFGASAPDQAQHSAAKLASKCVTLYTTDYMHTGGFRRAAVVTSSDVWAVGSRSSATNSNLEQPTALHWDGASWQPVSVPRGDAETSTHLNAVAAVSTNNIWVVGASIFDVTDARPYMAQWNGTSWIRWPGLNPVRSNSHLTGVDFADGQNGWAVGYYKSSLGLYQPLLLKWDGSSWVESSPVDMNNGSGFLYNVSVISAVDVWAVGDYEKEGQKPMPLVLHWDGYSWQVVPTPEQAVGVSLMSVKALSSTDIWAGGDGLGGLYQDGSSWFSSRTHSKGALLHWDGKAWTVFASPSKVVGDSFYGLAAKSSMDVWAVGYSKIGYNLAGVVAHWDGSKWEDVYTSRADASEAYNDIAIDPQGHTWVVGWSEEVSSEMRRGFVSAGLPSSLCANP